MVEYNNSNNQDVDSSQLTVMPTEDNEHGCINSDPTSNKQQRNKNTAINYNPQPNSSTGGNQQQQQQQHVNISKLHGLNKSNVGQQQQKPRRRDIVGPPPAAFNTSETNNNSEDFECMDQQVRQYANTKFGRKIVQESDYYQSIECSPEVFGRSSNKDSNNWSVVSSSQNYNSNAANQSRGGSQDTSNQYRSKNRRLQRAIEDDVNDKHKPNTKIGHYIFEKSLGKGTFGKVKMATHELTQEKVGIKILEKARIKQQKDIERISREIRILKKVRHPNIIQLYEIIETETELYLVMEFCPNGELFDFIVAQQKLSEKTACKLFQQMISGIVYLHESGICHRDLKPENLLLDYDLTLKIVDFGLSNFYEPTYHPPPQDQESSFLKTACGSPCYAAPEMISGKKYDGLMTDIWSSGVILFAMVTGFLPFEDTTTANLYRKILDCDYKAPKFLSRDLKNLLSKILVADPAERIQVPEMRRSAWLSQIKDPEPIGLFPQGRKCQLANRKQYQRSNTDSSNEGDSNAQISSEFNAMPIIPQILKDICSQFGFEEGYADQCIQSNRHNEVTATYHLMHRKIARKIKQSLANNAKDNVMFKPSNLKANQIIQNIGKDVKQQQRGSSQQPRPTDTQKNVTASVNQNHTTKDDPQNYQQMGHQKQAQMIQQEPMLWVMNSANFTGMKTPQNHNQPKAKSESQPPRIKNHQQYQDDQIVVDDQSNNYQQQANVVTKNQIHLNSSNTAPGQKRDRFVSVSPSGGTHHNKLKQDFRHSQEVVSSNNGQNNNANLPNSTYFKHKSNAQTPNPVMSSTIQPIVKKTFSNRQNQRRQIVQQSNQQNSQRNIMLQQNNNNDQDHSIANQTQQKFFKIKENQPLQILSHGQQLANQVKKYPQNNNNNPKGGVPQHTTQILFSSSMYGSNKKVPQSSTNSTAGNQIAVVNGLFLQNTQTFQKFQPSAQNVQFVIGPSGSNTVTGGSVANQLNLMQTTQSPFQGPNRNLIPLKNQRVFQDNTANQQHQSSKGQPSVQRQSYQIQASRSAERQRRDPNLQETPIVEEDIMNTLQSTDRSQHAQQNNQTQGTGQFNNNSSQQTPTKYQRRGQFQPDKIRKSTSVGYTDFNKKGIYQQQYKHQTLEHKDMISVDVEYSPQKRMPSTSVMAPANEINQNGVTLIDETNGNSRPSASVQSNRYSHKNNLQMNQINKVNKGNSMYAQPWNNGETTTYADQMVKTSQNPRRQIPKIINEANQSNNNFRKQKDNDYNAELQNNQRGVMHGRLQQQSSGNNFIGQNVQDQHQIKLNATTKSAQQNQLLSSSSLGGNDQRKNIKAIQPRILNENKTIQQADIEMRPKVQQLQRYQPQKQQANQSQGNQGQQNSKSNFIQHFNSSKNAQLNTLPLETGCSSSSLELVPNTHQQNQQAQLRQQQNNQKKVQMDHQTLQVDFYQRDENQLASMQNSASKKSQPSPTYNTNSNQNNAYPQMVTKQQSISSSNNNNQDNRVVILNNNITSNNQANLNQTQTLQHNGRKFIQQKFLVRGQVQQSNNGPNQNSQTKNSNTLS